MAQNSYYKTILNYFQSMDIEKLRVYLKESYTYQDTTKKIFLDEVQAIFEANKNSGDTELIAYPGKCVAECDLCDNCGKSGYRFIGNNSANFFDLIFEIEGDDIKDIYDCSRFETNEIIKNLGNQADIYIQIDDKVTFNKSPEYWSKINAATNAYSEIITTPTRIMSFEELEYWINKHAIINERIGENDIFQPRMKWTTFTELYAYLKETKNYISNHFNDLVSAKQKIEKTITEEEEIEWVMNAESLYNKAPYELMYLLEKQEDYFIFQKRNPIFFIGNEFAIVLFFIETYKIKEAQLLSKYQTYTEEELIDIYNNEDIDLTSLSFHIKKRKALKELGIEIPYYLSKKTS